jgi:hypothetical protein
LNLPKIGVDVNEYQQAFSTYPSVDIITTNQSPVPDYIRYWQIDKSGPDNAVREFINNVLIDSRFAKPVEVCNYINNKLNGVGYPHFGIVSIILIEYFDVNYSKGHIKESDIQNKLMHYLWDNVFSRNRAPLEALLENGVKLRTFHDFTMEHKSFIENIMKR